MDRPALIARLQARLERAAQPKTREWWERYLKGAIAFRGVKMGDVRAALHAWVREEGLDEGLSPREQVDLALSLFALSYAVVAFIEAHRAEFTQEAFERSTGRLPAEVKARL